ncbi:TFIIA-alpha and beta-like factor [Spea bombifrons]|uniref:TFIIA-alpha and beta-like factor n=1 Tax=Spea bombifrons TaxID=233779 RepID=UPI00234B391F|nr:TFIIA-alpha and beta-like factor [Spea bombifrons]
MAHSSNPNPVPKLYKSIIEDVIEGVRELFVEEGVDEHVLKELKQLWETKVMQSKATEGFFRDSAPQFVLQLPQHLHQSIHAATGLRNLQNFATNEMNSSGTNGAFTLPPGLTYPIHLPAGMTVQTASGQLYKVTVPVMVTQAPGAPRILQQSVQHYFQHISHPTAPPANSQLAAAQAGQKWQQQAPLVQKPSEVIDLYEAESTVEKSFANADGASFTQSDMLENLTNNGFNQPLSGSAETNFNDVLPPVFSSKQTELPLVDNADSMLNNLTMTQTVQGSSAHDCTLPLKSQVPDTDVQITILDDDVQEIIPVDNGNLNIPNEVTALDNHGVPRDIELIQLDGPGDTSSDEELGTIRDTEENEFLGIIDTEDLKALEEGDSASGDSTSNSSDDEDPEIDVIEEDPLNSGDDVSEQEVPDLFDTDNVIVCQYDKIHRSKNKWKFYLKDGVMSFGGKDYVFSKAIGEAEW